MNLAVPQTEYAELHVTSNFSFLTGASHPDEFVEQAAALGYRAIAITDRNSVAGIVRGHVAAKEHGVRFVVGCRLEFGQSREVTDEGLSVLVYPTSRDAYGRMCQLLTRGKRRAPKGECHLVLHDLIEFQEGLLAIVIAPPSPEVLDQQFLESLQGLRRIFDDDRLSLAVSRLYGENDDQRMRMLAALAQHVGMPLVATNDAHYHVPERRSLQDVVTCVRHGCTIHEAGFRLFANGERYLKSPEEMARLFAEHPQAIARTVEIADRAAPFSLDELRYEYPDEVCPPGRTAMEYLQYLTWKGAENRYDVIPDDVRRNLLHEFALIDELNYAPYFLTVQDLVTFARSRGILCQGRGAAANSAVCYCLGITAVDPARISLLFERFISKERNEPPDIDIDFEHERREEVIQYIYSKYGRHRAALTAEVITYRARSAVRDVGKALGFSLDAVDRLAKNLDWWSDQPNPRRLHEAGLNPRDATVRHLLRLTKEILGFPRHLSQHVGGFVMTRGRVDEIVPIENAVMEDRTVIEWDKDDIDAMGMLKVDVLGLGMLTCLSKAFAMVNGLWEKRRRDEETERRSEKGAIAHSMKEHIDGESEDIQRPDRVAERQGAGGDGLSRNGPNASIRTIWTDNADAPIRDFGPVEHRRRIWEREPARPLEVPSNSPRFVERIGDTARGGDRVIDAVCTSSDDRSDPRNRSSTSRSDQQPETKDLNHSVSPSLRLSVSYPLQLHTIPPEDPAVYDMICHADTIGVFQIESRAQMSMLPRLKPQKFYDLVIEVAIVRPGPIQGDMVHPYLRRRNGEEKVSYPHPDVERVLGRTLGVPLFQEQAMSLAMVAAGFSAGEADALRRAMAAWKRKGDLIYRFGARLVEGMLARGYPRDFAERCFEQIKGFSEYGFPESHAASFALLVYVSAWLKKHHPAAFAAALINSQPMGFYAPAQIVRDARDHGVEVRPVDVNCSRWDCTLEDAHSPGLAPSLRLGMRLVKGLHDEHARAIENAVRQRGVFDTIDALHRAANVPIVALRKLAAADAFQSMGLDRQTALWHVRALSDERLPMFEEVAITPGLKKEDSDCAETFSTVGSGSASFVVRPGVKSARIALPPVSPPRKVIDDYATLGLSLKAHPMSFVRERMNQRNVRRAIELKDERHWPQGRIISVAGVVLVRQRPGTASGIMFMTIEDETGIANLIIRPKVFERFRHAARHGVIVVARGPVERQGEVIHVNVTRMDDASDEMRMLLARSRDFH